MSAQDRGWGRGWPVNRRPDMVNAGARGVVVPVHKLIAPLVDYLFEETFRLGYTIRKGQTWGYANRAVTGSSTVPSNHSWGLAVDINAPANPYREDGRLITDMPAEMVALWKKWGFGWGGDYRTHKDAMHYEFMGTPTEAKAFVAKIPKPAAEAPRPPLMEVPPMFEPYTIVGRVVGTLKAPNGGVWLLTETGHIYALEGAPDYDMPARHPDYWLPDMKTRRIEPLGPGYRVVNQNGQFYDYERPPG